MSAPHVLLVNPWIYDFAAYDFWVKPLGLLYVARFFEQHGYTCSLIDCVAPEEHDRTRFSTGKFQAEIITKPTLLQHIPRHFRRYGMTPDVFTDRIRHTEKPCAILMTCIMTYWYPGLIATITHIKEIYPEVPIIVSGIYAKLCADHARVHIPADYIVTENAEIETLKLVDGISNTSRIYDTVSFDITAIDRPAYHLYPSLSSASMITSVGCPLQCAYCASTLLQPHFKTRDIAAVTAELDYYNTRFNVSDIAFYDDALLIDPHTHIIPILEHIIAIQSAIRFHTPNGLHIREITDELANLLHKAGFKTIRLSFESSDMQRQRDSSWKVTNDEFARALTALRKAGFTNNEIGVYMMIGLPGQTYEEIEASVAFVHAHKAKINTVQYSPIPGTPYYARTLAERCASELDPVIHNRAAFPLTHTPEEYHRYQTLQCRIREANTQLA